MGKKLLHIFIFIVGSFLVFSIPTAKAVTGQNNPIVSCNEEVLQRKPYQRLVVVDLNAYIKSGVSHEDIKKQLYYEIVYVRDRKTSPFNALIVDGALVYHACEKPDVVSRIENAPETGDFVIGVLGDNTTEVLDQIVEDNNLIEKKEASLLVANGKYNYAEIKDCSSICEKVTLSKTSWLAREYGGGIEKVTSESTVKQREVLSVTAFFLNNSENNIYPLLQGALKIVPQDGSWYHSSWISPTIIAINKSIIAPQSRAEIIFTLDTPLVPGEYSQRFDVYVAGKKVGEPFEVKVTVESENLQVATITPKGAPAANIRQDKSLSSAVLFLLDPGDKVILEKDDGAWVFISTKDGRKGWIYRPNIRL